MIFDSEELFPNSCVHYVEFPSYPLREFFAYLREKEELLQRALKNEPENTKMWAVLKIKLLEVESHLYFMVANCNKAEQRRRGTKALIAAAKRKKTGLQYSKAFGEQLDMFAGGKK